MLALYPPFCLTDMYPRSMCPGGGHVCQAGSLKLGILSGLENLFFYELQENQGKMTNQLRRPLRENCWQDRKIFPRTWKRTKIQTNTVPPKPQIFFVFVRKTDRRWFTMNCSWTVHKPLTNYMNIVFTSVYAALYGKPVCKLRKGAAAKWWFSG